MANDGQQQQPAPQPAPQNNPPINPNPSLAQPMQKGADIPGKK
jgi:hypothetical protein